MITIFVSKKSFIYFSVIAYIYLFLQVWSSILWQLFYFKIKLNDNPKPNEICCAECINTSFAINFHFSDMTAYNFGKWHRLAKKHIVECNVRSKNGWFPLRASWEIWDSNLGNIRKCVTWTKSLLEDSSQSRWNTSDLRAPHRWVCQMSCQTDVKEHSPWNI